MAPEKRSFSDVVDLTGEDGADGTSAPAAPKRRVPSGSSQTLMTSSPLGSSKPSRLNAANNAQGGMNGHDGHALGSREYPQSLTGSNSSNSITEVPFVDLTQDVDFTQEDDGPPRELYNTHDTKIVGVRCYGGRATMGEVVVPQREPHNKYDNNAIAINDVLGEKIGHLSRKFAEKLTPYMDTNELDVEGEISGPKGDFDCPIRLSFFGPSDPVERARIEEKLKKDKLAKAMQLKTSKKAADLARATKLEKSGQAADPTGLRNGGSTVGIAAEPEMSVEDILKKSEMIDVRQGGDAIKTLAMGENEMAKMPEAPQPSQLKATLLPYQRQALAWMTAKENPVLPTKEDDPAVQLWQRHRNGLFWNRATDYYADIPPQLLSGGILADDMGLGKTLEMISLVLTGGPGATLIVAPVSVMSNWEQQILRHVLPEHQPKVLIYHGQQKKSVAELQKYGVVITSYGKVSSELGSAKTSTPWRRIVLDEGHTIRNAKTKIAQAACNINAQSRWILTGTPIINSVKDLQSLVKFLRIKGGIEQPEVFNAVIARRLNSGDPLGQQLLQALMQDLCLRRRKDMKFVDLKLPEKKEFVHKITFKPEEKTKYDALLSEAKGALEEFQARNNVQTPGRFSNILERLLRLRQVCNHWTLARQRVDELLKLLENEDVVELTTKNMALLQEALKLYMEQNEECAICYELPSAPVITHCKHVFCRPCITKAIKIQGKCPMCRNDQLAEDKLVEPMPEGAGDDNFDADTQSSKTEAMLQIVKATIKKPGSKVIVFSQWTSFLNIVQNQLKEADIKFTRIDGGMKADRRDQAIEALDNDDETRVMLASLAVCSVGLNLVAADTVILSDSWWAPAIEDQAVDRVHRLGQTRETTVWRLVMENTVEDRVLQIQAGKRELVNKAFQEKRKGKKTKDTRMADVQKLLS